MLNLIKKLLQQFVDDIDSGNSNINEQEQEELLNLLQKFNQKELSKIESADYIGVCRATFDNYIDRGWIPKGHKRQGFKELRWNKCDLDNFLKNETVRKRL